MVVRSSARGSSERKRDGPAGADGVDLLKILAWVGEGFAGIVAAAAAAVVVCFSALLAGWASRSSAASAAAMSASSSHASPSFWRALVGEMSSFFVFLLLDATAPAGEGERFTPADWAWLVAMLREGEDEEHEVRGSRQLLVDLKSSKVAK